MPGLKSSDITVQVEEERLLVISGDRIAWVVGQRVAAGYEVDAHTRHVITLTLL